MTREKCFDLIFQSVNGLVFKVTSSEKMTSFENVIFEAKDMFLSKDTEFFKFLTVPSISKIVTS